MKIKGDKKLIAKLKKNCTMEDVKTVVRVDGALLQKTMQEQAQKGVAFKKGYSLGDLRKSIQAPKITDNGLTATVGPSVEYAYYVEHGTRYMEAEPFCKPALDKVAPQFVGHLKKLCK